MLTLMKTKINKIILLFLIMIMVSINYQISLAFDLETSIISLAISSNEKLIKTDPFFELLDMGDYLLVPLNALTEYLDLSVIYQRETNIVSVTHADTQRNVDIDIENGIYLDHVEWANEPPVVLEGEFYVTTSLIEYLADVRFEWNSKYQELTMIGSWFSDEEEAQSLNQSSNLDTGSLKSETVLTPTVVGKAFSLGSIQYKMVWENRKSDLESWQKNGNLVLNIHGRAGDWELSLGGETDLTADDQEIILSYLNAEYNKNNHLIILGDKKIDFDKTVGSQSLRGLYYSFPDKRFSKLVAYTSISGAVEIGDKVSLYVNEKLREEISATEEFYTFTHVPLNIKRINLIRVTIEKNTGEKYDIIKKIAASARILEVGVKEVTAALGAYRDPNTDNYEGQMVGVKTDLALTESISMNLVTACKQSYENKESLIYGSDLGLAFRLGEKTIITLDWVIGGESDNLFHGVNSTLLYCLENGYIESLVFYVPEDVSKGVQIPVGQGVGLVGVWDLPKNWEIKIQGDLWRPILGMELLSLNRGQLALTKRWGEYLDNSVSLVGKIEEKEILTENFIEENIEEIEKIIELVKETGVIYEHRHKRDEFFEKGKVSFVISGITNDNQSYQFKIIDIEQDISKLFSKYFLASASIGASSRWFNNNFLEGNFAITSQAKWGIKNIWVSGIGTIKGISNQYSDYKYDLEEIDLGFIVQHYFNENNIVYLNFDHVWKNYADFNYTKGEFGTIHRWEDGKGKLSCNIGYVSSIDERKYPQWSAKIDIERILSRDMKINVTAEQLYDTLWDSDPEHVFLVTLSHALGFTSETNQGQQYSGNEHVSFIGGIVYLDANGNGIMDNDEKRLSGIKMALDGRRTETNQLGEFRFDYVEPGIYRVGFDLKSLDADYTPVLDEEIVKIRENENIFLHYGLTINGSISGKVFIDKNANGKMDDDEEALQWVGICLNDNEKSVYTGKDGTFYLENLPLGTHVIKILRETLPFNMVVSHGELFEFQIAEEFLDIEGLLIPAVYKFVE
ncbi:MAG: hypothetical protein KAX49_12460 [Halanaerobiales bacterium]|nr:hypothetical protein [Halanaerobiales bacterium]